MSKVDKAQALKALQQFNAEYFKGVLDLLSMLDQKDLNHLKTVVETDDGGVYLMSILHVSGPKINFEKLKTGATSEASMSLPENVEEKEVLT